MSDIAREIGIPADCVELHGPYKAKIRLEALQALPAPRAKLVVVTAMTPTPSRESRIHSQVRRVPAIYG